MGREVGREKIYNGTRNHEYYNPMSQRSAAKNENSSQNLKKFEPKGSREIELTLLPKQRGC